MNTPSPIEYCNGLHSGTKLATVPSTDGRTMLEIHTHPSGVVVILRVWRVVTNEEGDTSPEFDVECVIH